jgi:predicted flap endonuclease-1-like 5' DNA nuclease
MAALSIVEGIGEMYEKKLKEIGITSTSLLLEKGATKKGRIQIATESDISEKLILKWVNHVDLMRIKGIGGEYAELLEAAGVDTVPELATRKAENLFSKILEVNETKKLVRKLPVLTQVEDWVAQAKELPKVIHH